MLHSDFDSPVILMCGISGSGKTYFSKKLEKEGYKRLSLDEHIWSLYGSGFSSFPSERRKLIFMLAAKEMDQKLAESIDKGEKVVLDSTMCKKIKREKTLALCREHGVEPIFIYLETPLPLLSKRLSRRGGTGPNDQIVSPEDLSSFYSNFEPPLPSEPHIVVTNPM